MSEDARLTPQAFVDRLRSEGARRYHDKHPFNLRMHAGALSKGELQRWVVNRYYYQTRIPIKDALIVAKSDEGAFRRSWIRRVHDHDGGAPRPATPATPSIEPALIDGGLAEWLALARAVKERKKKYMREKEGGKIEEEKGG